VQARSTLRAMAQGPASLANAWAWTREAGTVALRQAVKMVWQFNYGTNLLQ
jgi:hypothetical protein